MSKEVEVPQGSKFGRLTTLREVDPHIQQPSGKSRRKFLCRCICGEEVKVGLGELRRGDTKSCGCLSTDNKTSHGLSAHPFYLLCMSAINRCHNPDATSFKSYGGRGIKVFEPWVEDVTGFIRYVEQLPGADDASLSIDRIDNDGNYEPGNLRFATRSVQLRNRRVGGKVPFRGVYLRRGRFVASISINGESLYLGTYSTPEEASNAYEKARREAG